MLGRARRLTSALVVAAVMLALLLTFFFAWVIAPLAVILAFYLVSLLSGRRRLRRNRDEGQIDLLERESAVRRAEADLRHR